MSVPPPAASLDARTSNNYFDALPGAPGEQSFVQGRDFPPMMHGRCQPICVGDWLGADDATLQIHQSVDQRDVIGPKLMRRMPGVAGDRVEGFFGRDCPRRKGWVRKRCARNRLAPSDRSPIPSVLCVRTTCARGCDAGGPATTRANRTFTSRRWVFTPVPLLPRRHPSRTQVVALAPRGCAANPEAGRRPLARLRFGLGWEW
jgi:hypothetical protein